jgi:hypothetical protein
MQRNALHVRISLWLLGLKSGAIALDLRPFTEVIPLHIKFMVKCNDIRLTIKSSCMHPVFGPAFTPYRLFQWYPQSKKILLNLSMKCWNSAFKCTRFESNYNSCTGRSSENICSSSGGAQGIGKTRWNSVYHQNWWKN